MLDEYLNDPVFLGKIEPYIQNPAFQKLKLAQHHNDSIYDHTLRVAFRAYQIGKKWKADEGALLRGSLFHDLYFHDWRQKEHIINHGWTHPYIALRNAQEHFGPVTEHESNIISSHMWPFNITNPPRSKEAVILALADRSVASGEVIIMFFNFLKRTFKKQRQ